MKLVIQRVKSAVLYADGKFKSEINKGLLVYVGVNTTDTKAEADYLIEKLPKLRIFEDENGKMNLSVKDIQGEIMLVSNFTLYAETRGFNRPSFIAAARPEISEPLYDYFVEKLSEKVPTKTGVFGADMQIEAHLDGPINIIMEKDSINQ